jgi:hypothetical protein
MPQAGSHCAHLTRRTQWQRLRNRGGAKRIRHPTAKPYRVARSVAMLCGVCSPLWSKRTVTSLRAPNLETGP